MKKHKLTLTQAELNNLRLGIGRMLKEVEDDAKPWTTFGEEPPEWIQEQFEELTKLYNKLYLF